MATLQEILARAQALRAETALGSISPERAGSIMYDTLQQINQMQLDGLVISKIYESVAAMQADTTPVSDLTGQNLRQGQLVVIVPSDTSSSDLGSVYRYNGTTEGASSWSFTGKIGGYPMDQTPTQGSTRAVTSGGLYEQVSQLAKKNGDPQQNFSAKNITSASVVTEALTITDHSTGAQILQNPAQVEQGAKYTLPAADGTLARKEDVYDKTTADDRFAKKAGDPQQNFSAKNVLAKEVDTEAISITDYSTDAKILQNPAQEEQSARYTLPAADGTLARKEDVDAAMENKANVDGWYGGMTVGTAENLVGRGSVPAEIQGIRTSAGTADIGSGAAQITRFKGASIVSNQLIPRYTRTYRNQGGEFIMDENGRITGGGTGVSSPSAARFMNWYIDIIPGHIFYYKITGTIRGMAIRPNDGANGAWFRDSPSQRRIATASKMFISYYPSAGATMAADFYIFAIDLTLRFGSGYEPSLEECDRLFSLPYYAHNPGVIKNNEATALKTVGYNLYNNATGKAVLLGKYSSYPQEYEICGTFTSISFEDYAGNVSTPALTDGRFFNVDRPGVLTVVGGNDTDTLVHLVWSGWRNSDQPGYAYEPYWENILLLNIKTITGKLNGAGESVLIYPDGMRRAGSAYDYLIVDADGYARTAVKVIDSLDMGSLSWNYYESSHRFAFNNPGIASLNGRNDIMSAKYPASSVIAEKCITNNEAVGRDTFWVQDDAYSSAADFKAAMSGVELIYGRRIPLTYTLDEPLYMGYRVDDFGTEAKLPVDTADNVTAPIAFDVRYPMNAVDAIRNLPTNFLSKESTQNLLNALQSAGIIGGYTMTFDATAKEYNFTITAPSAPESNEA